MGRPLNLHKFGDAYSIATNVNGVSVGRDQIVVQAHLNGTVMSAYLVQQKKNKAFHVVSTDGLYSDICTFVNSASPVAGQMSCLVSGANLGAGVSPFYISKITNRYVYDFSIPAVKFFWGFVDQAPDSILDYPSYGFAVLPSAARTANVNEAP